MREFLIGIHQEDMGYYSWTRFASSVGLFMSVLLSIHQAFWGVEHYALITLWLGAALGTKTIQKFAESQGHKKEKESETGI